MILKKWTTGEFIAELLFSDMRTLFTGAPHNLHHADLRGLVIRHQTIWNKSLVGVDLSGSDFAGCHLDKIDFTGANLSNCYFMGTSFQHCILSHANLRGANLYAAELVDCELICVDLCGAWVDHLPEMRAAWRG